MNVRDAGLNSMTDYKIPTVKELTDSTEGGNHKFEVVSLFAGGGGSSTGYRMAGGKVLAVNEFIDEAVNTYQSNWPNTHILKGDVRNLTPEEILLSIGKRKGELDILDGSPPCSAFSTAGARDKGWGKEKSYSDSKQSNVEDLFFEYIRILDGIQPKVFVAENVSGLAKGVAKGYLNEIIRGLSECGYRVTCKVLDAQYLGVPQKRARTIFVGIREDLWNESMKGKTHPKPVSAKVTPSIALRDIDHTESELAEADFSSCKVFRFVKGLKMGQQHQKRFNLVKAHPHKPVNCITATNGKLGAGIVFHWSNRAFTVKETKRLMSVPDDYVLTGTYQQKIERLGRMVAPFMLKAVAENILDLGVIGEDT